MSRRHQRTHPTSNPTATSVDQTVEVALTAGYRIDLLEDAKADAVRMLTDLAADLDLVHALRDSHQLRPGFPGLETLEIQGQMVRTERAQRALRLKAGEPVGTGEIAAPGNLNALSVDAEVWATLHDHVRRIVRHLNQMGACSIVAVREGLTTKQLGTLLLGLVEGIPFNAAAETLVDGIIRDLEHLVEEVDQLLNGNPRARLGACPHCGRNTLVAYFREDLIRCDREPRSRHYAPCACSDPLCGCHENPSYRHTWHRLHTGSDGWLNLAGRIKLDKLAHPTAQPQHQEHR